MVLNRPTGTTIFVPLEERTALTKKMFVALEGQQNLIGYLVFDKKRYEKVFYM